jgi:hypothetical protein
VAKKRLDYSLLIFRPGLGFMKIITGLKYKRPNLID